jgi:DNA-binding CsgD family transcriptional regulator
MAGRPGIRKIANPACPCHPAMAVNDAKLRGSLDLVGQVADAPTEEEFTLRAADGLRRLFPAQGISFNEWDFDEHRLCGFHERAGYPPELDFLDELWPQCDWLLRQAPPERIWQVETMSDYTPLKTLKRRDVYDCVYGPIKIDHFMVLTVTASRHRRGVLLIDRDRGEFTDDERALGQLLIPPLARLFRSIRARGRLAARVRDLEHALREVPRRRASPDGIVELTPRELEVLEHVAAGRTDREIAALLYVSVRTVQKHLAHVYEKLGVRTRTAAAMLVFGQRGSQLDG